MTDKDIAAALKVGSIVKIRNTNMRPGMIVEFRGPFGLGGARIYGIEIGPGPNPADSGPDPLYTEVREDQLEVISTPD